MSTQKKLAVGFLLVAVAAAGHALLGVPTRVTIADVSLACVSLLGVFVLGAPSRAALLPAAGQLLLELALCGSAGGTPLGWALARAADLALGVWLAVLVLARARALAADPVYARRTRRVSALLAGALAVLAVLLPAVAVWPQKRALAVAGSTVFVGYSLLLAWYAVLAVKAYQCAARQNGGKPK